MAPHTAKIHTLITLGIRHRTKLLVFKARKRLPCGFDSHRPLHFPLLGVSLRCPMPPNLGGLAALRVVDHRPQADKLIAISKETPRCPAICSRLRGSTLHSAICGSSGFWAFCTSVF